MNFGAKDARLPLSAVARTKTLAFAGALILAATLVSGCGLIGGGDPEDEAPAPLDELQSANLKAEGALNQLAAERSKLEALQEEIDALNAQLEQAREAETEGVISLERARLEAIRHAQQNLDVYGPEYSNVRLVWQVKTASEDSEFHYIQLTYRPFEGFQGTPGLEEYIMDKKGGIEFRQVLSGPVPGREPDQEPEEAP